MLAIMPVEPPTPLTVAHAGSDLKGIPAVAADQERQLIDRAQGGCQRSFELLYRSHVRRVFSAVWRLAGGIEARAEELTQEAFIRAWEKLPQFRGDSAFATWLHRLAVNVALMDLRSRASGAAKEIEDDELESKPSPLRSIGLQIDLETAIASLPPRARAVLLLFDVDGWTHEEIAAELGMAVGSSKAQLHRARALLRRRLEE